LQLTHCIFDFDGTLADSLSFMFTLYNENAKDWGVRPVPSEAIEMIRHSNSRAITDILGISTLKLTQVTYQMRKQMRNHVAKLKCFDGIPEILQSLHKQGYRLGVVTSNDESNVKTFFQQHQLPLLDIVMSVRQFFGKAHYLKQLMKQHQLDPQHIIYIGDETRDIDAAKACGIRSCGVTWGVNTREALEQSGPDFIIEEPHELQQIISQIRT